MARKTGKLFVKEGKAAALPVCEGAVLSCRNWGQARCETEEVCVGESVKN